MIPFTLRFGRRSTLRDGEFDDPLRAGTPPLPPPSPGRGIGGSGFPRVAVTAATPRDRRREEDELLVLGVL